jgi:hypothetical protein
MAGQQKRQPKKYSSGGFYDDTAYAHPEKPCEQEPANEKFISVEANDQLARHDDLGNQGRKTKNKKRQEEHKIILSQN